MNANMKLWGLPLLLAIGLVGCGGCGKGSGGGSPSANTSTLNGVAAVGTPIVNASISVICAAGNPLSTTTSNTGTGGVWQVTFSGQTLPCAVELSNGTINGATNATRYHAIAVAAGTVNVTPLTDLMVANIVGTANLSTWFAGLTTNPSPLSNITQTQVNTALAALSTALSGLPQLASNNPITTPFTPTAGNVMDDMLIALAMAISNTPGVTYASLLGEVATTTTTTTVSAGFEANLTAAYATAASGSYTVGGTASGLTGSVVLQDNVGSNLTVSANGEFTFSTNLPNNAAYDVTVLTQPSGQTCTVSNGAGLVSGGNITNVVVVCSSNSNTYSVGGTVSGLVGSLVLQDNNGGNLTVSANGTFTFTTNVASGSPYRVTVLTQPASQGCSVTNGTGTIGTADVSNVNVTCSTNSYSVGGTVSGLSGNVVLQDSGSNNLTVSTNGIFNFSSTVAYGNAYSVTVLTQPSGQTCTVTGGSGTVTANVSTVAVVCTTNSGSSTTGQNVMPIIVDAGPTGVDAVNTPYTSVTICTPGTTTCQTIDHIIVDTGSTGLRIIASVLSSSLSLTQQTSGTGELDECLQFVDGYTWGSVKVADVQLGGEPTIHSLAVQIIGDPTAASVPRGCSSTGTSEDTVTTFGGNGILGVGTFPQDCGPTCVTTPAVTGAYYACSSSSGSSCIAVAVPLAQQIQNPVGMLSSDNNGVAITMPSVAATGSTAVSGSLILGIGTQSNNALGSVTVYEIDPTLGTLTTTFNGQNYAGSFLDSGSNALYFEDSSIPQCTGNNSGFYCPTSTMQLTATNQGTNGTSGTISFSVANASTIFGNASYTAASGLAGTAISVGGPPSFDWGFPFFFGRTVFTSIEGTSSGGVSGPYFAY